MIAFKNAKDFDSKPIPIAIDQSNEFVFYVRDNDLPAIHPKKSPLEYLSDKEIYALKRKYKVSTKILQKVQACYKNKKDHIELGDANCIENRLLIKELDLLEKKVESGDGLDKEAICPLSFSVLVNPVCLSSGLIVE